MILENVEVSEDLTEAINVATAYDLARDKMMKFLTDKGKGTKLDSQARARLGEIIDNLAKDAVLSRMKTV